jgi:hypothetical protein
MYRNNEKNNMKESNNDLKVIKNNKDKASVNQSLRNSMAIFLNDQTNNGIKKESNMVKKNHHEL